MPLPGYKPIMVDCRFCFTLGGFAALLGSSVATLALPARAEPGFVDIADLTVAAPVIVHATIARAERIADRDSPGLAPGHARLLVTAAVEAAIAAPGAVPAELRWLWDAPLDARGKFDKRKNTAVMAWLAVPDPDGKTRLASPTAQQPWTPGLDSLVRRLAAEAKSGTVPMITGVTNGFRADGTVAGESESQFFLSATDGGGAVMVVTTRPGMQRRVAISRGDVIDESAAAVTPGTLLWYRLACRLPSTLPATAGGGDAELAADWQAALASLGQCRRQG